MAIENVEVRPTGNPLLFDALITEDGVTRAIKVNKGMDYNELRKQYQAIKDAETQGQTEAETLAGTILTELKKPIAG